MRSLFVILFSVALAACGKPVTGNPPIPEKVITDIATVVASAGNNQDLSKLKKSVTTFLISEGGPNWYANYRKTFGPPDAKDSYVAETDDLRANKLGNFYVRGAAQVEKSENLISKKCDDLSKLAPTTKIYCGLSTWNALLVTSDTKYRPALVGIADSVMSDQKDGRLEWTKEIPSRNLKVPWISALTQSVAVSLFLRTYQLTGEEKYLVGAKQSYKWLTLPMSADGVQSSTKDGIWLEEYPNKDAPSHVLNGHMLALFGVWDYYRVTGDEKAKNLFDSGLSVIKPNIDKYDVGFWVVYDQMNQVDNINSDYLACVVAILNALGAISQDKFFSDTASKWNAYQQNDALFIHSAAEADKKSTFYGK